jgi:hypothetical protein
MIGKSAKNGASVLERVVTPTSLIIIDGDVVKTYTNPYADYSDKAADENVSAIWDLLKDKRFYSLLAPDPSTHISADARSCKNDPIEDRKLAQAIVVKTMGHSILAQFYKNAKKNKKYPVQVFDTEAKALAWFDSLRKKAAKT